MTILKHRHHPDEALLLAPAARPRAVDARPLGCVPGTSRAVLDELRADLDVVHTIQRVAEQPRPAVDFFAHYADDLRAYHAMRDAVQAIGGVLFESNDELDAVIVKALLPIAEQLAEVNAR